MKSGRALRIKAEGIELLVPPGSSVSVGRESDSTLTLHDDRVSRRHGLLTADAVGWTYTDLNSANGSFLNGQRVQSVRVGPGTLIRLGDPDSGPTLQVGVAQAPSKVPSVTIGALAGATLLMAAIGVVALRPTNSPAAVVSASPTASASPSPSVLTRSDIAAIGRAGTVYVVRGNAQGSGAYLGNGQIVTAAHVVSGTGPILIRFNDLPVGTAALVRINETDDVALLTIQGLDTAGAHGLLWGDSGALRQGDDLIALGYPEGLPLSTKAGVVSGLRRLGTTELIQTDASLNHGMSGGPVLDGAGHLVGLVDFGFPQAQGLNFAVASNTARPFVEGR